MDDQSKDQPATVIPPPAPATEPALISFDTFSKIQLRVGQVMQAERIAKSEKLLKLQVDLGETIGSRQIIAGIGKSYNPEEIVGRKIVVIANLETAKLMGQESQGMLLAATDNFGGVEILSPSPAIPIGSTVR